LRSNSAIRELKSRNSNIERLNSKFERLVWPEPVELRDGFESVCFDLVGRLVCSEPPELIELAVALEAKYARAAVELEAPDSCHSSQAVVGQQAGVELMARRASAHSAQDEPVRRVEARDEAARSAFG
jgi:hypothetical protein